MKEEKCGRSVQTVYAGARGERQRVPIAVDKGVFGTEVAFRIQPVEVLELQQAPSHRFPTRHPESKTPSTDCLSMLIDENDLPWPS